MVATRKLTTAVHAAVLRLRLGRRRSPPGLHGGGIRRTRAAGGVVLCVGLALHVLSEVPLGFKTGERKTYAFVVFEKDPNDAVTGIPRLELPARMNIHARTKRIAFR